MYLSRYRLSNVNGGRTCGFFLGFAETIVRSANGSMSSKACCACAGDLGDQDTRSMVSHLQGAERPLQENEVRTERMYQDDQRLMHIFLAILYSFVSVMPWMSRL